MKTEIYKRHPVGARAMLTIAVPTIDERREPFYLPLLAHLTRLSQGRSVEILSLCDNRELSIGVKRQRLLALATGAYIAMVDDDDWVADTYVSDIVQALEKGPDCVGFQLKCVGLPGTKADHSLKYSKWVNDVRSSPEDAGFDYVRNPNHLNPVRLEIARAIGYVDLRNMEDRDYSIRLLASGLLRTEEYIPKELYEYRKVF